MNISVSSLISENRTKYFLLLFFLWPFLAFILALANFSQKESKKVGYLFLVYYGLTFVLNDIGGGGPDAERYALTLMDNATLPFSDFFKIVGGIYATDTSVDIVEPLISFIVSRFTSNYNVLFGTFAAIFGYFYLRSINLLYDRYQQKHGWNALILMGFFSLILPITAINGFRMWTAAWIFFYGAYHVILFRDKRYLFLAMSSSLVHFSYLSANAVLLVYYFAGNRDLLYWPIAVISFILPRLITPLFQAISLRFGGGIQSRFEGYSNKDYIRATQDATEQTYWFVKLGNNLVFYYLLLAIIIVQIRNRYFEKDEAEKNLFSFLLLFLAFVNFGKSIPTLGERFMIVFILFATLYLFLYYLKLPGDKISILILLGLLPMALYVSLVFRLGAESINAWIFLPGLGIPMLVQGLPIADFLFR